MVRAGNRFNAFWQGRGLRRFCFDSVAGWTSRLTRLGFDVESVTRHDSGPFGNVLLQLRRNRPVSEVTRSRQCSIDSEVSLSESGLRSVRRPDRIELIPVLGMPSPVRFDQVATA